MTEESLGSKEAQEKIDEVAGMVYEDFHAYFDWGYEFGQLDAHSWEAGVKCGYWLAPLKEYRHVSSEMQRVRKALESLEIVDSVDIEDYEPEEAVSLSGLPMRGEQWAISFKPDIFYNHRSKD
ncbi:MAG: hypothetical protein IH857_05305 [Deltaproteobacteria bacterium]|nr:hypothetical protein [Deltaproteobacteria bacterium]